MKHIRRPGRMLITAIGGTIVLAILGAGLVLAFSVVVSLVTAISFS
jgi:hypothetical protein